MKKVISAILLLMMLVSVASCGILSEPGALVLDQTQSVAGFFDFKLVAVKTTKELCDSMGNGHYVSDDGFVYVDAIFDIKNTSAQEWNKDFIYPEETEEEPIVVNATGATGTEYRRCFVAFESDRYTSMSKDPALAPQNETRMHAAAIVAAGETEVTLKFRFGGEMFEYAYTLGTELGTKNQMEPDQPIEVANVGKYTLRGIEITDEFKPSNAEKAAASYAVEDPSNTYVVAEIEVTNLGAISEPIEKMIHVKVKYKDQYEYAGFSVAENESGTDFTTWEGIDPLMTRKVYTLFKVPDAIASEAAEFSIFINGVEYTYQK